MTHRRPAFFIASALALGAAALGLTTFDASDAEACGGFFCSAQSAVNQSAERIIFANNDDGTVTAVVQIQYQGPADRFSWVLPVPGIPAIDVSSDIAFQRLQAATNPNYRLQTVVEGDCLFDDPSPDSSPVPEPDSDFGNDPNNGTPDVEVVASGGVGPYDYEIISVNPDLGDPAEVAVAWLDDNGYDLTAIGPDVLRPYLADGMNLLAFRLNKTSDSGSIRPVSMTFEAERPMIPIKPTAVAATDNMGVMAFVLGEARAVPINYRHLVVNEAAINWFNPGASYNNVINLAADEAGGQGFVTEFAGESSAFENTIFTENERLQWENLSTEDWNMRHGELLSRALNFRNWDGFRDAVEAAIPLPQNTTIDEFLNCILCHYRPDQAIIEGFSPDDFIAALSDSVIEPMINTQALFADLPYMTRLYTTMSAREMDTDPVFDINNDLPDLDNNHLATRVIECSSEFIQRNAPWRIEFDGGDTLRGQGRNWPFTTEDMPANARIEQLDTEGRGEVVTDNTLQIRQTIGIHNDTVPKSIPSGGDLDDNACACATPTAPASDFPLLPLLLLGTLLAIARIRP